MFSNWKTWVSFTMWTLSSTVNIPNLRLILGPIFISSRHSISHRVKMCCNVLTNNLK
jgi:hypothetical protein